MATAAAICRPVTMPPAASTGTSRTGSDGLDHLGNQHHGGDLTAVAAGLGALRDDEVDAARDLLDRVLIGADQRGDGDAVRPARSIM